MINKVVEALVKDIIDSLAEYDINLTAKYSPDLPGLQKYTRDFFVTNLDSSPVYQSAKYQNALMYNIGTPKLPEDRLKNTLFTLYSPDNTAGDSTDSYTVTRDESKIIFPVLDFLVKQRVGGSPTGDGQGISRPITMLEIPLNFMVITESVGTMFDIVMLYYQKIQYFNAVDVSIVLNKSDPSKLSILPYYLIQDIDSLEINYANFQDDNVFNTIEFSIKLAGGFISNFYTNEFIIDKVELTLNLDPITSAPKA